MKISIITFHNTSNFGATLQCVALSKYLKTQGHQPEIVNYLPQYVTTKKSALKELRNVSHAKNKLRAFIKGIAYFTCYGQIKRRDECFEHFIASNLNLTRPYYSTREIVEDPPQADIFICGSDQIWNPALTGQDFDRAFFLQYAKGKKASYGASLGELDIMAHAEKLHELTRDFVNISVREKTTAPLLSVAIGKPVDVVLDCTLLLGKDDYSEMEQKVEWAAKPYVLLYNVQNSTVSVTIAEKIAREKNLEIVDISPNPFAKVNGSIKRIDIGPGEFLTLIKNSEYVVTNSFHGTVFSIIYEKQFFSIAHSKRSGRVMDLIESLQLQSRLVSDANELDGEEIDYDAVRERLAEYRQHSFEFLERIQS